MAAIPSFLSTPPSRNIVEKSALTISPLLSGTRLPTPHTRSTTDPVFWASPYEPNAVIKNDIEFILMQRKPGGYRNPSVATRVLSVIPAAKHHEWFQQIWTGLTGASTRRHPAPSPMNLAERLIRMFSFVGDTVLDPFTGTGTTNLAACKWGRNSIGCEVDPHYFRMAESRLNEAAGDLFGTTTVKTEKTRAARVRPKGLQRAACEAAILPSEVQRKVVPTRCSTTVASVAETSIP